MPIPQTLLLILQASVANNLKPDEEEVLADADEDDEDPDQVQETIELLKTQNLQLESVVYKLSDKLEETLL